jgi:hypothetical protein
MAGSYMDSPDHRIAWDRDGSLFTKTTFGNDVVALTTTQKQSTNDEAETLDYYINDCRAISIVFPVPMDLKAVFARFSQNLVTAWFLAMVETSKNTTNGLDGDWDDQELTINMLVGFPAVKPDYRTAAQISALLATSVSDNVKGIRFTMSNNGTFSSNTNVYPLAIHLYGSPGSLATSDRLAMWDPVSDVQLSATHLDWGNAPRGSSDDRSFRIKNLSASLTATDIDVYAQALTPGSPSVAAMHLFSDNGGATFLTTVNVASLAPGAVSPEIIVRRVVPADAPISVWSARVAADVSTWE